MTTPEIYIEAGRLLQFSTGEYSDYRVGATYVTLRPIRYSDLETAKEAAEAAVSASEAAWKVWLETRKGAAPARVGIHEMFQTALIERGFLMIVNCVECHIGSYGELDIPYPDNGEAK